MTLPPDEKGTFWDFILVSLCACWPFVGFINHNYQQMVYLGQVLVIWMFWTIAALILTGALRQIPWIRLSARAGIAVGIYCVAFFSFGALSDVMFNTGIRLGTLHLIAWAVLLAILLVFGLFISSAKNIRLIGFVVILSMTAIPASELIGKVMASKGITKFTATNSHEQNSKNDVEQIKNRFLAKASNVYWILPDGYLRGDALLASMNFDNSQFRKALIQRGFKVARNSLVNYPATSQSASTVLNMNYFFPVGEEYPPEIYGFKLLGFNRVVRRFKQHGYRYLHMEAGHLVQKTRCGGLEDICIKGASKNNGLLLSEADISLLRLTPLYRIINRVRPETFSADLTFMKDFMKVFRGTIGNGRLFSFIHILSPHFPNRYKKDCSIRQNIGHEMLGDYRNPEFAQGYIFDLNCLNNELLEAVDEILERDDTDPLIIIQSDHGVPLGTSEYTANDPYIAFRHFNAIRFPRDCGSRFHDNVTAVNTFRMVFSCIEGERMPLVQDRFFRTRSGTITIEELPDLRSHAME